MSFDQDPWATDTPAQDPWAAEAAYADEPRDEGQAAVPPTNTPTPSKERSVSEGKIVTTIKYGAGFDAPWTVIHSDSVAEAERALNEAKNLLELTARVAKYAKTLDSGTAPAAQRGGNGGGGQARQASTPPGMPSKSCAHGEMTYRTGNSAKGAWAGYFCPLEKGDPDQCKPVFVKSR
ncbi:hypothetical protein Ssi03_13350 [Sphaerisporangium siamense]|uniref:Uncharacterized protein n=1 Tax=Sphaerisporangium siamense TaxID=795645 RepID=A0A7W7GDD0_9ACTN|nr:hypothetical protein [Sphaerisporangium siamense]MBB4702896.1 hypothetical protein [Sphaerisporangium siamense]GII83345.1 hypothetical protein Ssi03_13350 [Sphaerisporangium siamense]